MYADDSKVFAEVNLNGESNLQMDINSILKWCKNWAMSLNCSKCKIMHFGSKNPNKEYFIKDGLEVVKLEVTESERDLGIIVSATGKTNQQVLSASSKANSVLGMMRKTFRFFNKSLFLLLYPTFIRPHLEFPSSAWNSMTIADKKRIESVQRRATKMVIEIRSLGYENRLLELKLTTLEMRRKRGI